MFHQNNKNQIKNKDILVIDDDEDTLNFLRKLLENAGHNFYFATSVEQGIKSVEHHAPHIILLDYKFPNGENGLALIKSIKNNNALKAIPIIMMSSTSNKKLILSAMTLGVTDFIGKPLKNQVLLQKIKKILKEHEYPVLKFKEKPNLQATGIGDIIKINEIGCILQSSIKFKNKTFVKIKSDYIKSLGAGDCPTYTQGEPKVLNPGVYRAFVSFQGMDEKTAKRIRQIKITD